MYLALNLLIGDRLRSSSGKPWTLLNGWLLLQFIWKRKSLSVALLLGQRSCDCYCLIDVNCISGCAHLVMNNKNNALRMIANKVPRSNKCWQVIITNSIPRISRNGWLPTLDSICPRMPVQFYIFSMPNHNWVTYHNCVSSLIQTVHQTFFQVVGFWYWLHCCIYGSLVVKLIFAVLSAPIHLLNYAMITSL